MLVVMNTKVMERGKTRCARYWPEVGQTEEFGGHTVTNIIEDTSKDYTLREFKVSKGDESRSVFHFHFLGWPDHGAPEDPGSFLKFLHAVNIKQESLGNKESSSSLSLVSIFSSAQRAAAQLWFTALRESEGQEPSLSSI